MINHIIKNVHNFYIRRQVASIRDLEKGGSVQSQNALTLNVRMSLSFSLQNDMKIKL